MEGIFLVFAMNNVVSIPIHTLLMSAGTLLPIISVVCILAFSISTNEQVPSSEKNKHKHIQMLSRCIWVDTQQIEYSYNPTLLQLTTSTLYAGFAQTMWWKYWISPLVSSSYPTSRCSSLQWLQLIGLLHSGEWTYGWLNATFRGKVSSLSEKNCWLLSLI